MTIPVTAIEQYLPVVLITRILVLIQGRSTFSVCKRILKCDFSDMSYSVVLSCGAVYCALQRGSNFESMDEILNCYQ